MSGPTAGPVAPPPARGRVIAIGCFMAWIGAFSGAMIGVLVSKIVAYLGKAPACEGIPTCDWYIYAMVGGAIGFLTLPWLVISALRRPPGPAADADEKF